MHAGITNFVSKWTDILKPSNVIWIRGDDGETEQLLEALRARNETSVVAVSARENCYAFFSSPTDVARMESQTFICSKEDPGPLNNAWDYDDCLQTMTALFCNVMQGRTMFVIPFCLGPVGGKHSRYGIQITDSEYACINMSIMCRVGQQVLDAMTLNGGSAFVPCIHSVGACDFANMTWPNSVKKHICHFINDDPFIMSYGSGYGGNALLSKKCFALRVASVMGRKEGWLAEHCLLLKMTSPPPARETKYVVAAFPSACGKTNLAMITPCKELMDEGWTFETLGDDIVWMHVIDGKLYAQNVENGFFGVAPGTNATTNGHAIASLSKDCIFTNCATYQNERGETDVWWEGLTPSPPASFTNWKGETNPSAGVAAAHPNARYTCPIKNCPILAKEYEDLVPIHAIIFGGRRETTIPLVTKATSVERGIFFGATLSSEETSANMDAKVGNIRFDPMAMRPFIGYNVCDYFQHWADVMAKLTTPVEFYLVNWFRKDEATKQFIWKGFSENSKVLKWIFSNSNNDGLRLPNRTSALGEHPQGEDIHMHDETEWQKLFAIKPDQLSKFVADVQLHFDTLEINNERKVPPFLRDELNKLSQSL